MSSQFSVVGKSEDSLDLVTHRKAGFTGEATAEEEPYIAGKSRARTAPAGNSPI